MEKNVFDKIIITFDGYLNELVNIIKIATNTGDFEKSHEDLKRWKARAVNFLKTNISEIEGENLEKKRKGTFIMGAHLKNLSDEVDMYRAFIVSLAEEIKNHPEVILINKMEVNQKHNEMAEIPKTKTVFIIHGHDEVNLLRLKELLRERWHLEPLVLSNEADTGRTLIEKFEQEAQRASFAIALLSGDDKVKTKKDNYYQPRPNVIFELGWFYGRLGRDRVCIFSKNGIKMHSDLEGIMRKDFKESIQEKTTELEIELKKAGLIQ